MTRSRQIADARKALLEGGHFLLLSHQNPDGDAIGSSLALAAGLLALGKTCEIVNVDGVPANLTWLPLAERVRISPEPRPQQDVVVLLDCGAASRTGVDEEVLRRARRVVNIDHHPGNANGGSVNLVDPTACATAELVWEVLEALPTTVGYNAAAAIYTAILTDTGSFRFSNANAKAFDIASRMVAKGVDPSLVAQMVYDQQPLGRIRLLSRVLETLELSPRDKAACVVVTREMFRETHTGSEDTEGFVNHPRSVFGVEVGFLLREETPTRHRVALRSKGRVDVSRIARDFGGGGHKNAAGATIDGTAREIKRTLFARVEDALDDEILQGSRVA
ncbi:MAG: bifunctional oligoribonuclease/PAP phosphatase NrnA [Deltaproteobacteria bacterium]|nr:bifunctional oligoribonuclease/PAP phosphatase NrnA [Deltaproteobacteria bacterium]